ncbi:MAG: fumarylacetoacetate hydrolase family protein [Bacteroidales bacterium]|nr:fumarylacetoacetate hydrolase family protein [Bacteroidales bacterium]MBS3774596.1 fumarylacetoacetate hydrolase family protein [Bacteroidales bacterium]
MKIICIGRNYAEHAKEFGDEVPDKPVFFLKPDTSLIIRNRPFFYPGFSDEIHYETEIVLKINRLGKNISKKFAHRYYKEMTVGIDLTARDLQRECKKHGHPWEIAKAFGGSAPLGKFVNKERFGDIYNLNFGLQINGDVRQSGNTKDLIFDFEDLISYISRFFTLKMGDLIFTGTPAGVGPVQIEDRLTAYIEDKILLDFRIK